MERAYKLQPFILSLSKDGGCQTIEIRAILRQAQDEEDAAAFYEHPLGLAARGILGRWRSCLNGSRRTPYQQHQGRRQGKETG